MVNKTIAIYVFVDELLNDRPQKMGRCAKADQRQRNLDHGHHTENALAIVKGTGPMPYMLGKSRFSRRLVPSGFPAHGDLRPDGFFFQGYRGGEGLYPGFLSRCILP